MARNSVDLPEPLDPTMPTASPTATSNETSLTAWTSDRLAALEASAEQLAGAEVPLLVDAVLDVCVVDLNGHETCRCRGSHRPGRMQAQSRA